MDLATSIQVAQIAMILVGGLVALVTLRNTVTSLKESLTAANTATEKQFVNVQLELKKLGEILIDQARFDEKLTSLDKRVTSHGTKLDELARGVGFVRGRKAGSIDREFPD